MHPLSLASPSSQWLVPNACPCHASLLDLQLLKTPDGGWVHGRHGCGSANPGMVPDCACDANYALVSARWETMIPVQGMVGFMFPQAAHARLGRCPPGRRVVLRRLMMQSLLRQPSFLAVSIPWKSTMLSSAPSVSPMQASHVLAFSWLAAILVVF